MTTETIEQPVIIDELEEHADDKVTCDFDDSPAEWRIVWDGCNHYGLSCTFHKDEVVRQWNSLSQTHAAFCQKCLPGKMTMISNVRFYPV